MKVYFRPLPMMTLACLGTTTLLTWLGTWQLERLAWKQDLIEQVEASLLADPVPLSDVKNGSAPDVAYMKVIAEGTFDHTEEVYLFTSKGSAGVGFQVITPLKLESGAILLVDRGFVPTAMKAPETRQQGQRGGAVSVTGVIRQSVPPNAYTPDPDLSKRVWYSRDLPSIAKTMGLESPISFFVDADDTPNPGGWPIGGKTIVNFSNNHLGYAITWFGMALALVVIYIAYHRHLGRLKMTKRENS